MLDEADVDCSVNVWLKAEELCSIYVCVYPLSGRLIALSLLTLLVSLWLNPQCASETQNALKEKSLS